MKYLAEISRRDGTTYIVALYAGHITEAVEQIWDNLPQGYTLRCVESDVQGSLAIAESSGDLNQTKPVTDQIEGG